MNVLRILPLFIFLLSFYSYSQSNTIQTINTTACPNRYEPASLEEFRDKMIKFSIENSDDTEVVKAALARINLCFPNEKPKCYSDMHHYIDKKVNPNDYPTSVKREKEDMTVQSILELPIEFLYPKDIAGLSYPEIREKVKKLVQQKKADQLNVKIPRNIKEVAAEKGWPNVLYKTRGDGGFNSGENLFIVVIPGEKRDIVIQTSPRPDPNSTDPEVAGHPIPNPSNHFTEGQGTLTMITIDKEKQPNEGQLRLMSGNGELGYGWTDTIDSQSRCTSCHMSPLKPISPRGYKVTNAQANEKRMTPDQELEVDKVNSYLSQFNSWGSKTYNGKEIRYGIPGERQPYGWAPETSNTRTNDYVKSCSTTRTYYSHSARGGGYRVRSEMGNPPNIDYSKVKRAMNCYECHNHSQSNVPPLYRGYSSSEMNFRVLVDKSMPHYFSLNNDERIALLNCMYKEFEDVNDAWKKSGDWMRGVTCHGPQFNSNIVPSSTSAGSSSGSSQESTNQ